MLKKLSIILFILFSITILNCNVKASNSAGDEFIIQENGQNPSDNFKPDYTENVTVRTLETKIVYTSGNYDYTIENDFRITSTDVDNNIISDKTEDIAVITGYTGDETTVTIPKTLGGKRVYKIDRAAFYQNKTLKKIVIPNDTVGFINEGAFADCTSLEEIVLGNSIENISFYAFQNTKIKSIKLPSSLKFICNTAFFNCYQLKNITIDTKNVHLKVINGAIYRILNSSGDLSLIIYPCAKEDKVLDIPSGVTTIEYEAVLNNFVETINIPATVTNISTQYTFTTKKLKNININSSNKKYCSVNGVVFSKDKKTLIVYPAGKEETTYNIPTGTIKIGSDAFFKIQNLKAINIPNTVKEIDLEAFGYTESLNSITIPSTVTYINAQTFRECTNLKKVIINANLEKFPYLMFKECNDLEEVVINGNIKTIGTGSFYYCPKLTKVTLPESLEVIKFGAFWCCRGFKSIEIPKNVLKIEDAAFYEYLNKSKDYWADTEFDISKTELVKQSTGDYIAAYNCSVIGSRDYVKAYEVLNLVNSERKKAGLKELSMDKDLLENAMLRAAEIVVYFEHERPSTLSNFTAITKEKYATAGENIAEFQTTPSQVMNSWMNSEGHRKNILTEDFTCIGIGCYKADNGRFYWAQIFTDGTPTNVTKPANRKTTEKVVTLNNRIPFYDVKKDSWYYDATKYVYKKGMITGYNTTTFAPIDKVSRGQLVTILWRYENKPDTSKLKNNFTDVPNTYYTEAIKWANSKGIVTGYGGTTKFGPDNPITRQDLSLILKRFAEYKGFKTKSLKNIDNFSDNKQVSKYAVEAVRWVVTNGIIIGNSHSNGTRTIDPHDNASRAEIAVMLERFCEMIKN